MLTRLEELPEQDAVDERQAAIRSIGGLLLALVFVMVISVWHLTQHQPKRVPPSQPADIAAAPSFAPPAQRLTVYLAGSPDHAAAVESSMDEANIHRGTFGELPLRYEIALVTADGASAIYGMLWDHLSVPASGPAVQVIDLRASIRP
jgi:hypothetical protein